MAKKESLDDESLEKASGGAISYARQWAGDREKPWEVIDDTTGSVVARFRTHQEAVDYARTHKYNTRGINSWDELYKIKRKHT